MRFALFRASVPVKALYYATEGHGFYREEHRREYYARLLAFFARHLGGQAARTGSAPADAKKWRRSGSRGRTARWVMLRPFVRLPSERT